MRRARKPINQINVVPYIDVMLVLLVIFMVTAPLVAPGEIQLPSVGSKLTNPDNPLNVRLEGKVITLTDKLSKTERKVSRDQLVADVLAAQATLATVAPGIAEALIATAIGLFAAIPAVVAYNRFTHDIDRLAIRFESFVEEFSNILQRQSR